MTLPTELLQAISAEEGGKVALIIGAGCSRELPTDLPLSRALSLQAHASLLANNVLDQGECADSSDLSCLADTVFDKTGHQDALIDAFPLAGLRNAAPNDGYRLAVALLREQALSDVLTLNFDLALRHTLGELNAGADVGVVRGPSDAGAAGVVNVIHLHRDADAPADEWILRTAQLEDAWKEGWEEVMTTRVMTSPVVVFAGLGTAAQVLVETIGLVRKAVTDHVSIHVDPDPFGTSEFTATLEIPEERFVQAGWIDFMMALATRVVLEQLARLRRAIEDFEHDHGLSSEDLAPVFDVLDQLNLLQLGMLRARWFLREDAYLPARSLDVRLLADLAQASSLLARELGVRFVAEAEGRLQIRDGDQVKAVLVPASAGGALDWPRFESTVRGSRSVRSFSSTDPMIILAAGVTGDRSAVAPPENIIGEENPDNNAGGWIGPIIVDANQLRTAPEEALSGLR